MRKIIYLSIVMLCGVTSAAQTVLSEDFTSSLPSNWAINAVHGALWRHSDTFGTNNTGCAYVDEDDTFGVDSGSIETVSVDLTKINNPVLSFKVATVLKNFAAPQLHLHYNTGSGWNKLNTWSAWGNDSILISSQDFTPPLDKKNIIWTIATYDLSSLASSTDIKFAFGAYVDNGGYLLLDSIRISDPSTLSIPKTRVSSKISFYPNPAHDKVYIDISKSETATVYVYDITGRQMTGVKYNQQGKQVVVNTSILANGIYYIYMSQADIVETKKIVINR